MKAKEKVLDIHVRAPSELRAALTARAQANRRSLHAEILTWLEDHWTFLEHNEPPRRKP